VPAVQLAGALSLYRAVASAIDEGLLLSAHDLSDGGLAVAAAEAAIGGRLGAELDVAAAAAAGELPGNAMTGLFSESPSRFLIEVDESHAKRFEELTKDSPVRRLGRVTAVQELRFLLPEELVLPVDELAASWKRTPGTIAGGAGW